MFPKVRRLSSVPYEFYDISTRRRLVSLSVCLENNSFGDKEAHLFASALRSNYYLRELNLQKNSIGARGKASLMRALCDTSSLKPNSSRAL